MANNNPGGEAPNPNHDFLEQLLEMQHHHNFPNLQGADVNPMLLHLNSTGTGGGGFHAPPPHPHPQVGFPLGLSLDHQPNPGGGVGFDASAQSKRFRSTTDDLVDSSSGPKNVFHGQPMPNPMPVAPHQPTVRPRVRARRGQATDPHSIAERLRRERIAERIRALQEIVPSVNKTDRAAMLDEIVDYVKFLRLQVKVLSMSRLGGAGAVVPLVTDMPISSVEEEGGEGGQGQPVWEKWSNDGTERQVAKLMEENVGAAMQFLQSKALCIMPVSLASAIYQTHSQPPDPNPTSLVKPESIPHL